MEDGRRILCGFCSRIAEGSPLYADQRETARTPAGVLYASWTAIVISRSAESQMQGTSTFFFKTLRLLELLVLRCGARLLLRLQPA